VHSIAVAETGGVLAGTVVVDAATAVDDLVVAVAIDVADAQVVVALAGVAGVAAVVAVEEPALGQGGAFQSQAHNVARV